MYIKILLKIQSHQTKARAQMETTMKNESHISFMRRRLVIINCIFNFLKQNINKKHKNYSHAHTHTHTHSRDVIYETVESLFFVLSVNFHFNIYICSFMIFSSVRITSRNRNKQTSQHTQNIFLFSGRQQKIRYILMERERERENSGINCMLRVNVEFGILCVLRHSAPNTRTYS